MTGGLCQATAGRPGSGTRIPRSLHAPGGGLQRAYPRHRRQRRQRRAPARPRRSHQRQEAHPARARHRVHRLFSGTRLVGRFQAHPSRRPALAGAQEGRSGGRPRGAQWAATGTGGDRVGRRLQATRGTHRAGTLPALRPWRVSWGFPPFCLNAISRSRASLLDSGSPSLLPSAIGRQRHPRCRSPYLRASPSTPLAFTAATSTAFPFAHFPAPRRVSIRSSTSSQTIDFGRPSPTIPIMIAIAAV
jgi:hypothetical protein